MDPVFCSLCKQQMTIGFYIPNDDGTDEWLRKLISDDNTVALWKQRIIHNTRIRVCSRHFNREDIMQKSGGSRHILIGGASPIDVALLI